MNEIAHRQGKCHGCLCWCDWCGDVTATCDSETCDRHRCMRCTRLLTKEDHEHQESSLYVTCLGCQRQEQIEDAEHSMLLCAKHAEDPYFAHDRQNFEKAVQIYAWHMKRLLAGDPV